jgi:starch synthase (maltosyl-transferring)
MIREYKSVIIQGVSPEVECGRYPVKRAVGDRFEVEADIFKDGHDVISAIVKHREKGKRRWTETPMEVVNPGLDRWSASFDLPENTSYEYTIEAWMDVYGSWLREVGKKVDAGQNVKLELTEGRELLEESAGRASKTAAKELRGLLKRFDEAAYDGRLSLLLSKETRELMYRHRHAARSASTNYKTLEVTVDRAAARYGAWYEMFHRSQGTEPGRGATFREAEERLPEIASLGFDVIYLLPIHPIGTTNRKGRNNALTAGLEDPGSPYAIGSEDGGHKAINPELGTLEDFRHFVEACGEHGMEVALDFAIQCSPDHPYIKEHPEWFKFRPDGTIKYAENPPKKYQDIVNVDWETEDWKALWQEWLDVVLFWVEQGVKAFRVDNPHTKPFAFWEWLISEVRESHPGVIFLAEAFSRPRIMQGLGKLGFNQSYTYFTWRNEKQEIIEYLTELTQEEPGEYMRPNFFANTHDILPHILQFGGRPAFQMRLALAATLSPAYGIYNGYELLENTPRGERGTTVYYADSEVYEYKVRDWNKPGNIKDYIGRINAIRRENPALQELTNLTFHNAPNDNVLFYSKTSGDNTVLVAVNLDPFGTHDAHLELPLETLGIAENEEYVVEEQISGRVLSGRYGRYFWVQLTPNDNIAEIFRIRKVGA